MLAGASRSVDIEHTVAIPLIDDSDLDRNAVRGGLGLGVVGEAGNAGIGEIYETQRCCEATV